MDLREAEVILSHYQAEEILAHRRDIGEIEASPDLGRSQVKVRVHPEGACFPNGTSISWRKLEVILAERNGCFVADHEGLWRIQAYSETTQRAYSLMPTEKAPTLLVSGIPMHRIKGTDPQADTMEKIAALGRIRGWILDTATGLGYTAIAAAETADKVVSIELDAVVLEIARENPWSRELFGDSNIDRVIGDSAQLIQGFPAELFQAIIHDPPTFSLAGELYSRGFYAELRRVLRDGGRLFHYVGDPNSRLGRNTTRGVVHRLEAAGFRRIGLAPKAFGVVARK
jgi:hypothetical protein